MDLRQLRYFVTIARVGQITRAAKILHMAQPPLSQQLKKLEEELGVPLFERQGKHMELTSPGHLLYKKSLRLLDEVDETITEVRETGEGLKGQLSVGCVKSCFAYLADRLRTFHATYPDITFDLREGDSYRLTQDLENRDIELAIIRLPLDIEKYDHLMLPSEPFVAVVPEHWQSAEKASLTLEEVARLPLLLLHRISGFGQYEIVINHFRDHGFEPHVVCECPDAAMLLELVHAGVGCALLPESTLISMKPAGVRTLTISDSAITARAAVIWLTGRYLSKKARVLIDMFGDHSR